MWRGLRNRLRAAAALAIGSARGKTLVVTGGCNSCGACCSRLSLMHKREWIRSERLFRRLQRDDADYAHFELIGREPGGELLFRCARLDENNLCSIHATRPSFCAEFPTPDIKLFGGALPAGCGYGITIARPFDQVLKEASGGGRDSEDK